MDTEITIEQPLTLRGFCETVYARHCRDWPPEESVIGNEFVEFFQIQGFVALERLQQLCETLGVTVRVQELPKGIRGFNHTYQEKREIVIGNIGPRATVLGSREHTLLHELREQIEYEFCKSGHPVVKPADKEQRAEGFASAVRTFSSIQGFATVFQDVFPNVKSGWGQFGVLVLLVASVLLSAFSCYALPQWEDKL